MAVEANVSSMSSLVTQSEPPKEFRRHNDARCAAVDESSYPVHLAMSVSYPNFMTNVRWIWSLCAAEILAKHEGPWALQNNPRSC